MTRPLPDAHFDELVAQALDDLPEELGRLMQNVQVTVSVEPRKDPDGRTLLGLYEGIPLVSRGNDYAGVLPDKITLFKTNIESVARTSEEVADIVKKTVIHEVAHHFGIDDPRLEELGWA